MENHKDERGTYARVDFEDKYIYLKNDTWAVGWYPNIWEYRAHELLVSEPQWHYQRIKRMLELPRDKKINVWYFKKRGNKNV